MKTITRLALTTATHARLRAIQKKVTETSGGQPAKRAAALKKFRNWRGGRSQAVKDVVATLSAMCFGYNRCMYCEDSEWSNIDHFKPLRRFPSQTFEWTNFIAACSVCNSKYKRDQYDALLLDPTRPGFRIWDHWIFDPASGHYFAKTPAGEATLAVLGFNNQDREGLAKRRKSCFQKMLQDILSYEELRIRGNHARAATLLDTIDLWFPALFEWLIMTSRDNPEAFRIINSYEEIALKIMG